MKKHQLVYFFVITFLVTWGLAGMYFAFKDFFTGIFWEMTTLNPIFILAVWGPTIAALIVTIGASGKTRVPELLKKFIPPRCSARWYLIALLAVPAVGVIYNLLTGVGIGFSGMTFKAFTIALLPVLITGPLGEELGWRGFALPRLLKKHSPIIASLFLGLIWGIWHFPSFFTEGLPQAGLVIPLFLLASLAISVVVTWLFLNTGGNVFISFLFHFSVNFTLTLIGMPFLAFAIIITVFAIAIFGIYQSMFNPA